MGTPAIESAGEHCHKLDDVSSQLHLKTLLGRGLQDNNFDPKVMAKLKNQISAEAQESILVIDHELTQLPLKNESEEFFQARFFIVQAGAQVGEDFERFKMCLTIAFELVFLSFEILLLVMTGDPGISQGMRRLWRHRTLQKKC